MNRTIYETTKRRITIIHHSIICAHRKQHPLVTGHIQYRRSTGGGTGSSYPVLHDIDNPGTPRTSLWNTNTNPFALNLRQASIHATQQPAASSPFPSPRAFKDWMRYLDARGWSKPRSWDFQGSMRVPIVPGHPFLTTIIWGTSEFVYASRDSYIEDHFVTHNTCQNIWAWRRAAKFKIENASL